MLCNITQVTLHLAQDFGRVLRVVLLPVIAGRLVTFDESLLFFKNPGAESCLLVNIDNPGLEERGFTVLWMSFSKQAIGIGRVTEAFLGQVQSCQTRIQQGFIRFVTLTREILLYGFYVTKIGKAQADSAQCVVEALLVGARQVVGEFGAVVCAKHFIQQADIGMQCRFVVVLLEACPAKFIECLLVEIRLSAGLKHSLVGDFCFMELATHKQVLTTSELGFIILVFT